MLGFGPSREGIVIGTVTDSLSMDPVHKGNIYNTPQKLDKGIRCMLACHN
jgi:hypothetical protein